MHITRRFWWSQSGQDQVRFTVNEASVVRAFVPGDPSGFLSTITLFATNSGFTPISSSDYNNHEVLATVGLVRCVPALNLCEGEPIGRRGIRCSCIAGGG